MNSPVVPKPKLALWNVVFRPSESIQTNFLWLLPVALLVTLLIMHRGWPLSAKPQPVHPSVLLPLPLPLPIQLLGKAGDYPVTPGPPLPNFAAVETRLDSQATRLERHAEAQEKSLREFAATYSNRLQRTLEEQSTDFAIVMNVFRDHMQESNRIIVEVARRAGVPPPPPPPAPRVKSEAARFVEQVIAHESSAAWDRLRSCLAPSLRDYTRRTALGIPLPSRDLEDYLAGQRRTSQKSPLLSGEVLYERNTGPRSSAVVVLRMERGRPAKRVVYYCTKDKAWAVNGLWNE